MNIQLSQDTLVRCILYFRETGAMIELHQLDGQQYFVYWADYENEENVYIASHVDAELIKTYYAGQTTHYQIQQQSPLLYIGDDHLLFTPVTFAELEHRDITPPVDSYYDPDFDPDSELNKET